MFKLATLLDNPGEPTMASRYRSADELKALGYNGVVLYETTGLSGVEAEDSVGSGEMKRWIHQQFESISQKVAGFKKAGLSVYISYDALSLARNVVSKEPGPYTCARKPGVLCPASEPAIEASVRALKALLTRFPDVAGVVLRVGDNDASRVPYLIGNDIYLPHCARCSHLGRADRIVSIVEAFYGPVVEQLNKRLILRAWNVKPNGLHDSVDLCKRVVARLPGKPEDDRLVLSFKFTQTDFWRYQKWNAASLACGGRPVIYELQCQREFEGKGAIPNWQVPLWRNGMPETENPNDTGGLANVAGKINLVGLWAWVRGGGWGGPFINNEQWIDANVYAVPRLADNPSMSLEKLAQDWVQHRLGLGKDPAGAQIERILFDSPQMILMGFYIRAFAKIKSDGWHPNADWIQDDLVDAQAAWRIIQRLPLDQLDSVITEKQQAVDLVTAARDALSQVVTEANRSRIEPLVNTLDYGGSLFLALRDLLTGLVAYRRHLESNDAASAEVCRERLHDVQNHWAQHTQDHSSLPGAATAFREHQLWELTEQVLTELGG
jgi:hypothetical protein